MKAEKIMGVARRNLSIFKKSVLSSFIHQINKHGWFTTEKTHFFSLLYKVFSILSQECDFSSEDHFKVGFYAKHNIE